MTHTTVDTRDYHGNGYVIVEERLTVHKVYIKLYAWLNVTYNSRWVNGLFSFSVTEQFSDKRFGEIH